jgi:LPLT family lysophospholipid transporter-like MFS transporter
MMKRVSTPSCRRSSSARWPTTPVRRRRRAAAHQRRPRVAARRAGADVRAVLRGAGALRRRVRRLPAQGQGDVRVSNTIKVVGCLMMLFGTHPLLAYAVVGLGAAAYSPAKYGILTELLPPSQLVKANGWIEGLTIASIILGVLLGGQLVGPHRADAAGLRPADDRHRHRHRRPRPPSPSLIFVYACWRLVQPAHPAHRGAAAPAADPASRAGHGARLLDVQRAPVARQAGPDLAGHHHAVLGRGGQPALHRAGLGRGGAGLQHHAGLGLVGVVAIGTAVGAVVASMRMRWTAPPRDPAGHRAWAC